MKQLQTKKTNTVNNVFYRAVILLCAMGMSLTGCKGNESSNTPVSNEADRHSEEKKDPPVERPPEDTKNDVPEIKDNPPVEQNTEQTPEVTVPEKNPNTKPSKDNALSLNWSKLDSAAKAGQSYYSEYYTKTRVTTKNGYLYNYASSTQITAEYLINEGILTSAASGVNIMLMYGSDIAQYGNNVYISGTDREFTVFAFMKHPSENKYIFSSANGSYGTLSENSYNSLMGRYSMDHGTIRRLTPSNGEYDRILSCIKMYESRYEQYFVRSITVDDKYAFVVLSGRANAATIREYILRYDNGIWEVVMDDLETEGRLPVTVNKNLPDFNMSLLPTYSIKDYTMLTDYSAVVEALTKAGLYVKDDTFYYFCGTNEFCYMISDSGKRFLCRFNGEIWECYKVLDYYDALSRLQNFSSNPPTFILLDLE